MKKVLSAIVISTIIFLSMNSSAQEPQFLIDRNTTHRTETPTFRNMFGFQNLYRSTFVLPEINTVQTSLNTDSSMLSVLNTFFINYSSAGFVHQGTRQECGRAHFLDYSYTPNRYYLGRNACIGQIGTLRIGRFRVDTSMGFVEYYTPLNEINTKRSFITVGFSIPLL